MLNVGLPRGGVRFEGGQGRDDDTSRWARWLLFPAVQENRIELDRTGSGVAVLSVQGEHDVYTAPSLTEHVEGLIDARVPFVIDLTPATFVDSSVLRVLLEARRRAEEEGVGFAVALDQDDSGAVRRVLEVTGLIPVLAVHPARDAAMEAASTGHNSR
jgi:anti-sigma B factor antagonist